MASYFYHANAEDFLGVLFSVSDLVRYLKLARWQGAVTEAEGQIILDVSRVAPGALALMGDEPERLRRCRDAGASVVITGTPRVRGVAPGQASLATSQCTRP